VRARFEQKHVSLGRKRKKKTSEKCEKKNVISVTPTLRPWSNQGLVCNSFIIFNYMPPLFYLIYFTRTD
jgi:hypothetical protein